jgi:hypothetical protein
MRMFAEALATEALATEALATEALATEALATEANTFSRLLTASSARRMKAAPYLIARREPPITAIDEDER